MGVEFPLPPPESTPLKIREPKGHAFERAKIERYGTTGVHTLRLVRDSVHHKPLSPCLSVGCVCWPRTGCISVSFRFCVRRLAVVRSNSLLLSSAFPPLCPCTGSSFCSLTAQHRSRTLA